MIIPKIPPEPSKCFNMDNAPRKYPGRIVYGDKAYANQLPVWELFVMVIKIYF